MIKNFENFINEMKEEIDIKKKIEQLLDENKIEYNNYWIFRNGYNTENNTKININGKWKIVIYCNASYTVYEYDEFNSYPVSKKTFENKFNSIEEAICSLVDNYKTSIDKGIELSDLYDGYFCGLSFELYNDNNRIAQSEYELKK
jgi:hypothetical protein